MRMAVLRRYSCDALRIVIGMRAFYRMQMRIPLAKYVSAAMMIRISRGS